MFRSVRLSATAFLALALALPPALQAKTYQIDPAHSSVSFRIRHFVGKVRGQFREFSGSLDLDGKDLSKASVKAEIQAASIDTGNERRDKHLRSKDFFETDKYPTLTFTSGKVTPSKEAGHATLEGTLEMHGVKKPVSLELEDLGEQDVKGMDGVAHKHRGFEARGKLNRDDYGITWNKAGMLGDDVEIELQVEAVEGK